MPNIILSNGMSTEIDEQDSDLMQYKWSCGSNGYAVRATRKDKETPRVILHRAIVSRMIGRKLNRDELVDHKDMNVYNNKRSNLRVTNKSGNGANSTKKSHNKSGFKGVTWDATRNKWKATVLHMKKQKFLGRFDLPEDAARAYDRAAVETWGEFARINFPPSEDCLNCR